jgi:hypothetical protein
MFDLGESLLDQIEIRRVWRQIFNSDACVIVLRKERREFMVEYTTKWSQSSAISSP